MDVRAKMPKALATADVIYAYSQRHPRPAVDDFLREVNDARLDREIKASLAAQKRIAGEPVSFPCDPKQDKFSKEMARFERLMKERFPEQEQ